MDMTKRMTGRLKLDKMSKGETDQMADQLAPLEEQNKRAADQQSLLRQPSINQGANQEVGAIVIDNTPASLSADITDVRRGKTYMGMEPVTLVILVGMLCFIVFITWPVMWIWLLIDLFLIPGMVRNKNMELADKFAFD